MLLALVLYSYCCGEYSSRAMARHCDTDVAYRVITADHRPHHGTISRFIAAHDVTVESLFLQVLAMCQAAGMVRLGMVAIDGTKIAAAASLGANRSRKWLEEQAREAVAAHRRADEAEDKAHGEDRGDELPEELANPKTRAERIRQALEQLRSEDKAAEEPAKAVATGRAEQADRGRRSGGQYPFSPAGVAAAEAALAALEAQRDAARARYEQRRRDGVKNLGRPIADEPAYLRRARESLERTRQGAAATAVRQAAANANTKVNITDPTSRIVRDGRGATLQGYNAQAAVSQDQVVIAASVVNERNDQRQLLPMIKAARANLAGIDAAGEPGLVLADGGYCSHDNLTAPDLPDMLIGIGKRGDPDRNRIVGSEAIAAMVECLSDPRAAADYAKRAGIVEPIFADAKNRRGLRRFRRRGLRAVNAEWNLICLTHNLMKLFRQHTAAIAIA
jgi:hypothetical protein